MGSIIQDSHCPYQPFGCQTRSLPDRSQRRRVEATQKLLHDCLHYTDSVNQEEAEISQNRVFDPSRGSAVACITQDKTKATIACTPYSCRDFGRCPSLRPRPFLAFQQQGFNVKFKKWSHISIRLIPRFSPETSQPTFQDRKWSAHHGRPALNAFPTPSQKSSRIPNPPNVTAIIAIISRGTVPSVYYRCDEEPEAVSEG